MTLYVESNFVLEHAREFDFGLPDGIVLASILADLDRHQPAWSCFINRDHKDFDLADVRNLLAARDCKLIATFEQGLNYARSRA